MPRCFSQINDSTGQTAVLVVVDVDDKKAGKALAAEAAHAAYAVLSAEDGAAYPPEPNVITASE